MGIDIPAINVILYLLGGTCQPWPWFPWPNWIFRTPVISVRPVGSICAPRAIDLDEFGNEPGSIAESQQRSPGHSLRWQPSAPAVSPSCPNQRTQLAAWGPLGTEYPTARGVPARVRLARQTFLVLLLRP